MRELSLSVLDLIQNSIRSGATVIEISVNNRKRENELIISVKDNGCGMTNDEVENVADPFYTTCSTHKVGLGVPLFVQRALLTGGGYVVKSEKGSGTVITAYFNSGSVDFVPLGDMKTTLQCLAFSAPHVNFIYNYSSDQHSITLDFYKLYAELDVDMDDSPSLKAALIKEYLTDKIIQ